MCKLYSASIYSLHILELGNLPIFLDYVKKSRAMLYNISLLATIVMHAHSLVLCAFPYAQFPSTLYMYG
jgi:hypothetical protein